MSENYPDFDVLKGKTITGVVNDDNERITFNCEGGESFVLYHDQDCCETVKVEEIIGDLGDLVGLVVEAEEVTNADGPAPQYPDSWTWTFYKVGTTKGFVTIRWLGVSNGHYSERVTFAKGRP